MDSLTDKTYTITYTYLDCLKKELMNNEELKKFFKDIDDEYQKILIVQAEALKDKIEINNKTKEDKIGYAEGLIEKLRSMGLNFSKFGSSSFMCNDSKISYNYLLEDDTIFSKKEKSRVGYLSDRKIELVEILNKNINKLREKEGKKSFLSKRKDDEKKESLKKLIAKQQDELDEINDTLAVYDVIDNLTSEQRILLLECIREYQESFQLDKENSHIRIQIEKLKNIEDYDVDLLPLAFKRMVAFKTLTKEGLERIFLMLDKVEIKARRGEYDMKKHTTEDVKKIKPLLKWFVGDIYEEDEKFVERNKEKIKSNN